MRKRPDPTAAQLLFAKNMYRLRVERQLTQEQVAELAELHPVYISGCEGGKRNLSIRNMAQIAFALDVPLTELIDTSRHKTQTPKLKVYKSKAQTVALKS